MLLFAVWDINGIGDKIRIKNEELTIAGLLKDDPFSSNGLTNGKITLITSGETFTRLTGIADYSLLLAQTTNDITDEEMNAISNTAGENCTFRDNRGQRTTGAYTAFVFCVYGFLSIITLVAVLNMINSISMSVSGRIRQYGTMRVIGMDRR